MAEILETGWTNTTTDGNENIGGDENTGDSATASEKLTPMVICLRKMMLKTEATFQTGMS